MDNTQAVEAKAKAIREFGVGGRRILFELDLSWLFSNKEVYKKYLIQKTTKEGNTKVMLPMFIKLYGENAERAKVIKEDLDKGYILKVPGFLGLDLPKGETAIYPGWSGLREFTDIPKVTEATIPTQVETVGPLE